MFEDRTGPGLRLAQAGSFLYKSRSGYCGMSVKHLSIDYVGKPFSASRGLAAGWRQNSICELDSTCTIGNAACVEHKSLESHINNMSHFRNGPVAPGIAFITGGARGLGNAIAVAFAKEGSKGVALVDIQKEETFNEGKAAVEKYGAKVRERRELAAWKWSANDPKCITIHADVTKEEDVERAVKETVDTFGRIDYAAYPQAPKHDQPTLTNLIQQLRWHCWSTRHDLGHGYRSMAEGHRCQHDRIIHLQQA